MKKKLIIILALLSTSIKAQIEEAPAGKPIAAQEQPVVIPAREQYSETTQDLNKRMLEKRMVTEPEQKAIQTEEIELGAPTAVAPVTPEEAGSETQQQAIENIQEQRYP
jgi:hypothetical protein